MVTAYISVFKNGKQIDSMYPGKHFFRKHESEPTTSVAIRRSFAEDLYVVLAFQPSDLAAQSASLQINVNPLVDWIWFGFAVMAIGTGIALLPERTYAFALAKLPEAAGAATTSAAALLLMLWVFSAPLLAQHEAGTGLMLPAKNPLETRMREEIGCTCGGCEHEALSKCVCGQADQMRTELRAQVDLGKTHEEIISHFIAQFGGQQFLRSPIDEGFNRFAWLVPYGVGAVGLVFVGLTARRWSRHPEQEPQVEEPKDPAIEERLDDELRNLD
jgi:cytochrome c-type biogenesis protein CcmF